MWNSHYIACYPHFATSYYPILPAVPYETLLATPPSIFSTHHPPNPSVKKQQHPKIPKQTPKPEPVLTETRLRQRKKPTKSQAKKTQRNSSEVPKRKQKQYRNVPSNICRFFVLHLYNHPTPHRLLPAAADSPTAVQISECIREAQKHIRGSQTYVRPRTVEALCRGELISGELGRVFRTLFSRFLKQDLKMIVACQGKMGKKEKIAYFRVARRYIRGLGFE